jgi:hypothetical protein
MSVWYAIAGLIVFTVIWPFVDVGVRNGLKRRARGRQQARVTRVADA